MEHIVSQPSVQQDVPSLSLQALREFEDKHHRYIEAVSPEQHEVIQKAFSDLFHSSATTGEMMRKIDGNSIFFSLNPQTLVQELNTWIQRTNMFQGKVVPVWEILERRIDSNTSSEEIYTELQAFQKLERDPEVIFARTRNFVKFLLSDQIDERYFSTPEFESDLQEVLEKDYVAKNPAMLRRVIDQLEGELPHRRQELLMLRQLARQRFGESPSN